MAMKRLSPLSPQNRDFSVVHCSVVISRHTAGSHKYLLNDQEIFIEWLTPETTRKQRNRTLNEQVDMRNYGKAESKMIPRVLC